MELKIDINELRKKSLFLAVPMYGGKCDGPFAKSLVDLAVMCAVHGIEFKLYLLFNESLVTRARNYCADEFMRAKYVPGKDENGNNLPAIPYSHMMFIDADIAFNPNDVIAMLAMMDEDNEYDIMTGPYPKKNISWEKIKTAVDKGVADENPNELENYVGDYVFNPVKGNSIRLDEPAEIAEGGTGFMMIRRQTFEKFKEAYPEYSYKPDHIRSDAFDGSREIMMYFQAEIVEDSKRYLSEDYWFSYKARQIGLKLWLCPWMRLQHGGFMMFGGSLVHLASLGVSPTADVKALKKGKR